jgi:ankyrin repeat protein
MDQLCRISTSAGVQTALNSLPRGLYGTYSRILNGISPENEIHATRALRWLAHAAAPLGLPELVEAIAVEEDSSSLGTLQKLFVHEDIFQICGSLVRRSEFTGMLSLAHNSVYEFLTTPSSQSRPLEPYYIPTAQSAISLARTCLTYLSFQDFNMVRIQATVDPNLNFTSPVETWETEAFLDRPFFDYALRNWWKHIPASQEDVDQVWPNLLNFFDHETGNFGSLVMLLRHLEGTYRYPMAMQPIHFCATHGLYLVSHRLLGDTPSDVECAVEDGRRALHIAADNGHEDMVRHLLSHDADANKKTLDGRTPLQLALESGNESIVKLLVRGGADVNANFANGETPLSVAVGNKWHSLVRFLLGEKADPNGRLLGGRTSLHVAAEVGSDGDLILLLSDAGADHILGDENSWTALHFAAHYGHEEAALMLMRDPKTPTVFEKVGWTPLHAAIEQEHIEVVRLFDGFAKGVSSLLTNYRVKQQATSPATSRSAFSKALGTAANTGESSRSSTNAPSLSTPEASPAGSTQERVPTPLLLATSQGYLLGVDALMEAGVDSEDVKACIQRAFAKGKGDILERLVRGSEQHIQSLLSLGGKGVAAPQESRETLEFLFRSFQWKVHDILAAMKQVIRQDDQNLLQLLVEQFIQLEDEAGHQKADMLVDVLHVTVQCRNVEAVQLLLVAGAEVSRPIKASLGRHESKTVSCTLLHLAAHLQDSNMVSCLLSNSLSPDIRDAMGRTPLHYAVQYRDAKDVTITLLSSGADASVRDRRGWTPLHVASHYGVSESVPPLLAAGAAIDAPDDEAMTPLHHCAFSFPYNGQFPMPAMLLLLEGNASTSSVDKAGYTPIQLALVTSIRTTAPGYLSSVLDQQTDLISTRLPPLDWTPLHFAANANCGSPILNLLVSRKADLEALDREGKTPLQVAGPTTHQLLLNHGAKWRK